MTRWKKDQAKIKAAALIVLNKNGFLSEDLAPIAPEKGWAVPVDSFHAIPLSPDNIYPYILDMLESCLKYYPDGLRGINPDRVVAFYHEASVDRTISLYPKYTVCAVILTEDEDEAARIMYHQAQIHPLWEVYNFTTKEWGPAPRLKEYTK